MSLIKDSSWVRQSFVLPDRAFKRVSFRAKAGSTASVKFTDTTPGGNLAINPPPQYCEYTDIRVPGLYNNPPATGDSGPMGGTEGMGRYYSEAIDDNSQIINMRFGVPQFNSLTQFFGNFYSHTAGSFARTGRGPGFWYTAGKVAGTVLSVPFMPLVMAGQVVNFFVGTNKSKYYYLKPTMPLYWSAVNTMLNGIAVNMGIVPRVFGSGNQRAENASDTITDDDLLTLSAMMPDIIQPNGSIDAYALATKAQRLAHRQHLAMLEAVNGAGGKTSDEVFAEVRAAAVNTVTDPGSRGISAYLQHYAQMEFSNAGVDADVAAERVDTLNENGNQNQFSEYFGAEQNDGAQFVGFRVNHTGEATESFTNSASESELGSKLNGLSSSARMKRFSFADGNVDGGMISGVMDSVKNFVAGGLDGIQMSGLMSLAGNGFVDIPKQWDSSEVQLPTASYTMELRTPYGNKISRLLNLYVPMTMILAGGMPISTGLQSYTSPFICELFSRGRNQSRLSMIDSIQITRGKGNLGWTQEGEALGIDITFSVVDLSSIMSMPLVSNDGLVADVVKNVFGVFDDDNAYTDYLAVLGGLGLDDQIYQTRKLALSMTRNKVALQKWTSPAFYASKLSDFGPARLLSTLAEGTARQ